MKHKLYTIHNKWDWNESKMLIEFLTLNNITYNNPNNFLKEQVDPFWKSLIGLRIKSKVTKRLLHLEGWG